VAAVADEMEARDAFLADVRHRLEQAQAVQKLQYDKGHREVSFEVGDWAFLRLRQRLAASLPRTTAGKLKPRYVGPYRVTELINKVAVRLELSAGARLHDVFHVGVLRKFVGRPPASPPALPLLLDGAVVPEPQHVAGARLSRGVRQVLVAGAASRPRLPPGRISTISRSVFRPSSSRTSWSSTRGEMSCTEGRTSGNDVRGMSAVRTSALIAPRKLLPPNLVAKFRKE
jgi:hypothetical protein